MKQKQTSNKRTGRRIVALGKSPRRKNLSSGLVIVTVLWVVILLGVIAAAVGRASRLDAKVILANMQGVKLRWACRAGIDTAAAVLSQDSRTSDNLRDLWSENEEDFNNIELDGYSFDVVVVDEASKLNVNTATKKQLLELPEMTEETADSIIDWRDNDNTPSQTGAEGGYYENLLYGYKIRNGPFRTIRELLFVNGGVKVYHLAEQKCTTGYLYSRDRPGCQYSILTRFFLLLG